MYVAVIYTTGPVTWEGGTAVRYAVGTPNVREYGNPTLLVDLALQAEEAGWDGFFLWDHLVYRDPFDSVADPWTVLSAIASRTRTLRLGIMVCALARRRPWKVARETATLDILSGGRLIFGVGLGSLAREEFAAFGEVADDRVRADKVDEGLEIVSGLWTGEPFSHRGQHYSLAETVFRPRPIQNPVPIWVAGRWPARRPFRRAARWQGAFVTHQGVGHQDMLDPSELAPIVEYVNAHRLDTNEPFDITLEGFTPTADRESWERVVTPYAEVGLTWWVEKLGWFRGNVKENMARVRAGPPATDRERWPHR
jgi:alkanesulfonate monooxygenase SsuD/methylene tetrahydromethanopterin reductase-like flavin-dependent oxidoreductase (luciferase family)